MVLYRQRCPSSQLFIVNTVKGSHKLFRKSSLTNKERESGKLFWCLERKFCLFFTFWHQGLHWIYLMGKMTLMIFDELNDRLRQKYLVFESESFFLARMKWTEDIISDRINMEKFHQSQLKFSSQRSHIWCRRNSVWSGTISNPRFPTHLVFWEKRKTFST